MSLADARKVAMANKDTAWRDIDPRAKPKAERQRWLKRSSAPTFRQAAEVTVKNGGDNALIVPGVTDGQGRYYKPFTIVVHR